VIRTVKLLLTFSNKTWSEQCCGKICVGRILIFKHLFFQEICIHETKMLRWQEKFERILLKTHFHKTPPKTTSNPFCPTFACRTFVGNHFMCMRLQFKAQKVQKWCFSSKNEYMCTQTIACLALSLFSVLSTMFILLRTFFNIVKNNCFTTNDAWKT
jgi:hypothetical protein